MPKTPELPAGMRWASIDEVEMASDLFNIIVAGGPALADQAGVTIRQSSFAPDIVAIEMPAVEAPRTVVVELYSPGRSPLRETRTALCREPAAELGLNASAARDLAWRVKFLQQGEQYGDDHREKIEAELIKLSDALSRVASIILPHGTDWRWQPFPAAADIYGVTYVLKPPAP